MQALKYILAILLLCGPAVAEDVDRTVQCDPDGDVQIGLYFGDLEVEGWDRDEVSVTGSLPSGASVEIDADGRDVEIELELESTRQSFKRFDGFTVRVPRAAAVSIEHVDGDVVVRGLEHELEIEVVSGDVDVHAQGGRTEIEIESVSGDVEIETDGDVVSVEAVSGDVRIAGARFDEVSAETVSGDVRIDAGLSPDAEVDASSHSGDVTLVVAGGVSGRFDFSTFSGSIDSDLGPAPRRTDEHAPGYELEFSTGGSAEISAQTFSWNIELRTGR